MYTKWLLKSIFLLVSNAFLHLGEIVVKTKTDQHKVTHRNDITFEMSHATPVAVVIKVTTLFQIHLKASGSEDMCPVKTLYKYVQTYGYKSGPLF